MAHNIKGEESYELKLEESSMPGLEQKIEDNEFETNEDDQFDTGNDLEMAEFQDPEEAVSDNIIGNLMVEDDTPETEAATDTTYIAIEEEEEEIGQEEQFLRIPRGKTQITLDGNIVFTDELEPQFTEKEINEDKDDEAFYYEDQDHQESEDIEMVGEEQVTQLLQSPDGTLTTIDLNTSSEGVGVDTLEMDAEKSEEVIQINNSLFSGNEVQTIVVNQESPRGIKRAFAQPSTSKNTVTKLFIRNNSSSVISQPTPIKIIGNIGSVMGARHMSLKQAQRLGLVGSNLKIQQVASNSGSSGRMIVKKIGQGSGGNTVVMTSPAQHMAASSTKVQFQTPGSPAKGNMSVANFTPVRTNMPISQLKAFNTVNTSPGQIKPVAISKGLSGITFTKTDGKTPQKVYMRTGNSVVSPAPGQIARFNPAFQPIQISTGKNQVHYLKLVTPGSVLSSAKPKLVKPQVRTVSLGSPAVSKPSASVMNKTIYLPAENSIEHKQVLKGKAIPNDDTNTQEVLLTDESSENIQDEYKEFFDDENSGSSPHVLEASGIRPKKPCNCTKSQCLKLYCECFANGEFCYQCNCHNCFNNIEHEDERQLSIRSCLERNPDAFRPKFQVSGENDEDDRRVIKGCNCRRSGCLKNYCECFEAKRQCSKACRCAGCKNNDGMEDEDPEQQDLTIQSESHQRASRLLSLPVKEAFCQCIVSRMEDAENKGENAITTERYMLEEFGQCLVQIIGNWNKRSRV